MLLLPTQSNKLSNKAKTWTTTNYHYYYEAHFNTTKQHLWVYTIASKTVEKHCQRNDQKQTHQSSPPSNSSVSMSNSFAVLYVHTRSSMKEWSHAIRIFFSFIMFRDWCDLAMCAFCMHFIANTFILFCFVRVREQNNGKTTRQAKKEDETYGKFKHKTYKNTKIQGGGGYPPPYLRRYSSHTNTRLTCSPICYPPLHISSHHMELKHTMY